MHCPDTGIGIAMAVYCWGNTHPVYGGSVGSERMEWAETNGASDPGGAVCRGRKWPLHAALDPGTVP
jgi:hypothetical protein